MKAGGVQVDELRDNGGCGIEFYFYDPDGNKYCAWELQTMIRYASDDTHTDWKKKFVFENCYLQCDVDTFFANAKKGTISASSRIKILENESLVELASKDVQELISAIETFNSNFPNKAFQLL